MARMAWLDLHRDESQHAVLLALERGVTESIGRANWRRQQQRQIESKNRYFHKRHMDILPTEYDPAEAATASADASEVCEMLTSRDFEILMLTSAYEMTHEEAAAHMGISSRTLRRRLASILHSVRCSLVTEW